MKAAQLLAPGRFEIVDVPTPVAGAGEVLLRVSAAGVCHTDVAILEAPALPFNLPMTLGHETTGVVESFGQGAKSAARGDAVIVSGIWGCGICPACSEDRMNACHTWIRRGAAIMPGPGLGHPGGMAEYMVAPVRHVFPIGDLDPMLAAPLADAGATPNHAVNLARAHLRPEATVVVVGVGGLGHLAVQILRATTGCRIVAVDRDAERLTAARQHGADLTLLSDESAAAQIQDLTSGLGADVVFDFVGATPTLALANRVVAQYGMVVIVGVGGGKLELHANGATGVPPWGAQVVRPYGGTMRDVREVIALAQQGRIKASIERFRLADAPAVLAKLAKGEVKGRAVLVP